MTSFRSTYLFAWFSQTKFPSIYITRFPRACTGVRVITRITARTYFIIIGYPQGHFEQTTPVAAAAAPMAGQPVIPLPPNGQPASYAPPAFLVPPPQFIPPQTAPPSIINYVPGPNGPAFQPNFQGYQGYSPPVQVQSLPQRSSKLSHLCILTNASCLRF